MSVHEIWEFFKRAQRAGISAVKLALVREDDAQGGVKAGSVPAWQRKLLSMYRDQSRLTFFGVNRLAIASDASRHACRDFQVAVAYDPLTKAGCHFTAMYVPSAKIIFPGEFDMPMEIERLAARRETERLKTLRFMQALSAQLFSLVKLKLENLIPDPALKALLLPASMDAESQSSIDSFEPFDFRSSDATRSVPVVHIILDQASVGCASAAFLTTFPTLIHFSFDKIHRLHNDLKCLPAELHEQLDIDRLVWPKCGLRFLWNALLVHCLSVIQALVLS